MKDKSLKLKKIKNRGLITILFLTMGLIFNLNMAFANPCVPGKPCGGMANPTSEEFKEIFPQPKFSDFLEDPKSSFFDYLYPVTASPEMHIQILLFDLIVDLIVFTLLVLILSKLSKIKVSTKSFFGALSLLVLAGLIADIVGMGIWRAVESDNAWIYFILSIFSMIVIADSLISKYILKFDWKNSIIVGASMAIFTHPALWAIIFSVFKG